jgi:hypothetical protein
MYGRRPGQPERRDPKFWVSTTESFGRKPGQPERDQRALQSIRIEFVIIPFGRIVRDITGNPVVFGMIVVYELIPHKQPFHHMPNPNPNVTYRTWFYSFTVIHCDC